MAAESILRSFGTSGITTEARKAVSWSGLTFGASVGMQERPKERCSGTSGVAVQMESVSGIVGSVNGAGVTLFFLGFSPELGSIAANTQICG